MSQDTRIFVPLPLVKPQQLVWHSLKLHQNYQSRKSELIWYTVHVFMFHGLQMDFVVQRVDLSVSKITFNIFGCLYVCCGSSTMTPFSFTAEFVIKNLAFCLLFPLFSGYSLCVRYLWI